MRILHTADWHLGKIVHGLHMTEDQREILNQFIDIIIREKPNVIVIAGDIYDRAVPPKEAVELLNDMLNKICVELNIPIVAVSGNHDSVDRLGFGTTLFRSQQLYLTTTIEQALQPVTFTNEKEKVCFHLIPYLEPEQVKHYFEDNTIQTHQDAMERLIQQIEENIDKHAVNIFVGHAFIAGGMESDSEERLTMIGGSPYIDAALFKSFDYVALGHLHQAQQITNEFIRYSGSLLKYSFSEAKHMKSVVLLDIEDAHKSVKKIPLKPKKDMRIIEGYFQDLLDGTTEPPTEDYVQIKLLDDGQIIDPVSKLRKLFPNILHLERKHQLSHQSLKEIKMMKQKQEMTHEQLFSSFYQEIKGEALPEERATYVQEVIQEVMTEERER